MTFPGALPLTSATAVSTPPTPFADRVSEWIGIKWNRLGEIGVKWNRLES